MTRHPQEWWRVIFALLCAALCAPAGFAQPTPQSEFIAFRDAQPVIHAFADSLPTDLKPAGSLTGEQWTAWVRKADWEVRERLDKGEEDTLTNLLRFGVTYTKEYRVDDQYLLRYGQSSLVDSFAENRANDLVRALANPASWPRNSSEGMARMRAFLEHKGFSFKTPAERMRIRKYLLENLARMRDDVLRYRAPASEEVRAQLFKDRGISLDTNLWPDFLLDAHFRHMAEQGLLKSGSVRKIAIVGPGLDFANKEKGNDFYPPQTIQPFAVLDSLIRLGITNPELVELYTLDISVDVNVHVKRAKEKARAGEPYTVQLPWNTAARQTEEYRRNFISYWQQLGDQIGQSISPIPVPSGAAETQTRAVKIRPDLVLRLTPIDMNIVYQRFSPGTLPEGAGFDLIIGTNIFIYYDSFEKSLARSNVAAMLKPGGFLLSNDKFPSNVTSGLEDSLQTTQLIARDPERTDTMYCYRKVK
jgi:hypothetical protein